MITISSKWRWALLKYGSLFTLVIQTTVLVLLLRYSRTMDVANNNKRYLSSTAIVVSESLKILVCLIIVYYQNGKNVDELLKTLFAEVWSKPRETTKLVIPAALYTIQNNLLFVALSNLDAATYQVTYQLKILTTAIFSVTMLRKRLGPMKWLSLVILMIGVALVQWPNQNEIKTIPQPLPTDEKQSDSSAEAEPLINQEPVVTQEGNAVVGLLAVFACCVSSGFSGVYFEKLVKFTQQGLWIRNIQLAIFGFLLGLLAALVQDMDSILLDGFFQGYTPITWAVILLQTFGGLIVATVMKYADNILKGFATSISIVLSTICSYYILKDFEPTMTFISGAGVVIFATILYGL